MKKTKRRPREDEAALRGLFARHAASGLSTGAFCAKAGVSSKSFYRWRSGLIGSATKPIVTTTAASAKHPTSGFIDSGGLRTLGNSRVEMRLDLGGGVLLHRVRE